MLAKNLLLKKRASLAYLDGPNIKDTNQVFKSAFKTETKVRQNLNRRCLVQLKSSLEQERSIFEREKNLKRPRS